MMKVSRQDIRLAARTLRKHPGFATTAVLSLALAIALNTTMYSVFDALVNPKVELRAPDRLYRLGYFGDPRRRLQAGDVERTLRSGMRSYEVTGFKYQFARALMERGSLSTQATLMLVRPDLFAVLGARPAAGRLLTFADTGVTETPPVMVSERLAAQLFPRGSPVGRPIVIDGKTYGVIGVLNHASQVPSVEADAWILPPPGAMAGIPLNVLRLRDSVSYAALDAELKVLAARLAAAADESVKDTRFAVVPFTGRQFAYHRFDFALMAAVAAVLLVACANLANLQLARGISRARELALRSALGASRADIIAHLLIESTLLTLCGLAVGLALTLWGVRVLGAAIPPGVGAFIVTPQTSWRMFAFAVAASVLCTVLVGLIPAIRVSHVDPAELIKAGNGTGANKRNRRRYSLLVTAEIGLSLTLLTGAALVVRQAWRVDQERFGFDPKPLARAWMQAQPTPGTVVHFDALSADVVSRVRRLPGVAEATVFLSSPVYGNAITITDPGRGAVEVSTPMYGYSIVSPSYFRTYQLPIVKGRDFFEGERDVPEVVVDRKTANFLWPNSNPIGAMIKLGESKSALPWVRVVGVVGEADGYSRLSTAMREGAAGLRFRVGDIYLLATGRDSTVGGKNGLSFEVVARARGDAARLPLTLAHGLQGLPGMRRLSVNAMEDALGISSNRAGHNFVAAVFGLFAALAIGMASLGIYGIVAHSVAERRRELGVRIAFGASPSTILNVVLREGNAIALAGIALGLFFTKYDAKWLNAFTAEEDEYSAVLFAVMALCLFSVTVVSALIPALRATRVDPVEALRSE